MSDTFSASNGNSLLHDFLDKKTFCQQLGITARTADRWNLLRIGPPRTKAGRKILYRKAAIAEWLQRREQAGTQADQSHRTRLVRPLNPGRSLDGTLPGARGLDAQLVNAGRG